MLKSNCIIVLVGMATSICIQTFASMPLTFGFLVSICIVILTYLACKSKCIGVYSLLENVGFLSSACATIISTWCSQHVACVHIAIKVKIPTLVVFLGEVVVG